MLMRMIPGAGRCALALAACVLAACAGGPPLDRKVGFAAEDLLDPALLGADTVAVAPVELVAVNDDMRAFLDQHVPEDAGDQRKVELILGAILEDGLHLSYNNFKTYSAEEAFYSREGNCLSFTNLFVALAREAGVDVHFQEVAIPPSWAQQDETWFYNLHINAVVDIPGTRQVVDFSLEEYSNRYRRWALSDQAVLARYHNNMGVHWMNQDDHARSFQHFRQALLLDASLGFVWTNLGTLFRRAGDLPRAEAAYLIAVQEDEEPAAISNLARFYQQLDEPELAAYYLNRVQIFRRKNPYYLQHLAEEAYARADYDDAATLLRTAIRRNGEEHEFHRLLGLVHTRTHNLDAAERSFRRAASLVEGEEQGRYNHKLELLAGQH